MTAATPGQASGVEALKALAREWREKADEPDRKPESATAYVIAARDLEERIAAAAPQVVSGISPEALTAIVAGNRAALGLPPQVAAATPGQAAHDAFFTRFGGPDIPDWPPLGPLPEDSREAWEAAARAAIAAQDAQPAPADAATPGQAAGEPPALYARWHRVDTGPGTPDDMIAENWRVASREEREFWTELQAAQDAQPAPGTLRADLEAQIRVWREVREADEALDGLSGDTRETFGDCADELATILAEHPERQSAPELAALRGLVDEMLIAVEGPRARAVIGVTKIRDWRERAGLPT